MRRTGQACRSPTGLLRSAGHLPPRIRGGVCPGPLRGTRPSSCRARPRSAGGPASSGRSRRSAWLLCGRIAELAACPFQILIRRHVLLAEFPRAQLAQRLGELAIGVVGGVLAGPPDVIPQLAVFAELPEFCEQGMHPDQAVNGDLVPPALGGGGG